MITGRTVIAGIMGWPVAHSRSPRLHGYWLRHHNIDGAYVPFAVRPEHLGDALRALPKLGIRGVNLTIPHKESALSYLDQIDPFARALGAVNTVIVDEHGTLNGFNSDIDGFQSALMTSGAVLHPDRPALLLGAGGAARAVAAALGRSGWSRIMIANRNLARAQALKADLEPLGFALSVHAWDERDALLQNTALVVNATSLGMSNHEALELNVQLLPPDASVADIVYTPLETPLLMAAKARGLQTIDGLGMLLYQGRPGFAAWFGVMPDVTAALRAYVLGDQP